MIYFIPPSDAEKLNWLNNLKIKLPTVGAAAGLSTGDITSAMTWVNAQIALLQGVEVKKAELSAAVTAKDNGNKTNIGGLRTLFKRLKTLPSYTTVHGNELGIISTNSDSDEESVKPGITATIQIGFVRIKFTKGICECVNIYTRLKGEADWKFLTRDTHSPYDDHRATVVTGTPDHREYSAVGVLNDIEIGLRSDIVSVVFGG